MSNMFADDVASVSALARVDVAVRMWVVKYMAIFERTKNCRERLLDTLMQALPRNGIGSRMRFLFRCGPSYQVTASRKLSRTSFPNACALWNGLRVKAYEKFKDKLIQSLLAQSAVGTSWIY